MDPASGVTCCDATHEENDDTTTRNQPQAANEQPATEAASSCADGQDDAPRKLSKNQQRKEFRRCNIARKKAERKQERQEAFAKRKRQEEDEWQALPEGMTHAIGLFVLHLPLRGAWVAFVVHMCQPLFESGHDDLVQPLLHTSRESYSMAYTFWGLVVVRKVWPWQQAERLSCAQWQPGSLAVSSSSLMYLSRFLCLCAGGQFGKHQFLTVPYSGFAPSQKNAVPSLPPRSSVV